MSRFRSNLQKAISASSTLLGSILLFGMIGYYLMNEYKNDFWFISFLILGSLVGLFDLYKQISK
ncbi:MAG: hypothetical protein CMF80_02055 [Candidatus Marinimicrobia bacterium]|nr:hypothetical protein [Candidatus Neomarinimicrobiota bacterium]|tara:strand:- start:893 stop:1084 length:192 start_codon:yes stop_codon:yes gene_type:complete